MESLSVIPDGNNYTVSRIDSTRKSGLLRGIADASTDAQNVGVRDGELTLALAAERDMLDPAGITWRLVGGCQKYLGSVITCILVVLAIFVLFEWLTRAAIQVGEFLKKTLSFFPWLMGLGVLGGAGIAAASILRDENTKQDAAVGMATGALRGLVLGFLPLPLHGAIAAVLASMGATSTAEAASPGSTSGGSSFPTSPIGLPTSSVGASIGEGAGGVAESIFSATPIGATIAGAEWLYKKLMGKDEDDDLDADERDELESILNG